ncbi:MAG TPA: LuxR C-terminal-related transcriptional regulator [Candidatus Dormibacteraeota bacterium]
MRLTRRQHEVADLLVRGLSNREMAQALFLSERTVEGHVKQLCNLLGVNSRTQVALWWARQRSAGEPAEPAAVPARVVVLMCELLRLDGAEPAAAALDGDDPALRRFDQLMAELVERGGGRMAPVSRSPRASRRLAVFDVAGDAAAVALDVQQAVATETWPGGASARFRAALHAGEAEPADESYSGLVVETCARLLDSTEPRQVLASAPAASGMVGTLPDGVQLWRQAGRLLDGAAEASAVFQVIGAADRPWLAWSRPPDQSLTNLPLPLTTFVGRQMELVELRELRTRHRLLTLVGVGGGGKTRLALQLGREVINEHAGGVWLVDLAAVVDPQLVAQTFATALGVREQAGRPFAHTLVDHLRARNLLLVVDNCEHVLDEVAQLVQRILTACSGVWVLATSREPLRVPGELRYRVPSLAHPRGGAADDVRAIASYDSVQLFIDRARSVQPDFEATEQNAAALGRICRQLDGIPLAIELAAGWTYAIGVDGIVERLEDRFRLLISDARTVAPRQQTLAATLDWSHDLLSEPERRLFRRLGVFSRGFGPADVERVCLDASNATIDVFGVVNRLVDKSFVVPAGGRYQCLETIREYARRRLAEAGELETFVRRHAEHCAGVVAAREPGRMEVWLAGLDRDVANVRAALAWSLERDLAMALTIAGLVFPYWQLRGLVTEARMYLEALVKAAVEPSGVRCRALILAAGAAYLQNDIPAGATWIEESLAMVRRLDPDSLGPALRIRGQLLMAANDLPAAERCFQEAVEFWRQRGDSAAEAQALHDLGQIPGLRGEIDRARALYERSLDLRTELGIREEAHVTLTFLALLSLLAGDPPGARPALLESLESARRLQDRRAAWALDVRACVAAAEGDPRRALVLAGAAAAMHRVSGTEAPTAWGRLTDAWLGPARASLPGPEVEAARVEGDRMGFDAALAFAVG